MYIIPPWSVQMENGFARVWGFAPALCRHLFSVSFMLVSYYKTFLMLLLAVMAHTGDVLTDMLTDHPEQCANVPIWAVLGANRFYLYDVRSHRHEDMTTSNAVSNQSWFV